MEVRVRKLNNGKAACKDEDMGEMIKVGVLDLKALRVVFCL